MSRDDTVVAGIGRRSRRDSIGQVACAGPPAASNSNSSITLDRLRRLLIPAQPNASDNAPAPSKPQETIE